MNMNIKTSNQIMLENDQSLCTWILNQCQQLHQQLPKDIKTQECTDRLLRAIMMAQNTDKDLVTIIDNAVDQEERTPRFTHLCNTLKLKIIKSEAAYQEDDAVSNPMHGPKNL